LLTFSFSESINKNFDLKIQIYLFFNKAKRNKLRQKIFIYQSRTPKSYKSNNRNKTKKSRN